MEVEKKAKKVVPVPENVQKKTQRNEKLKALNAKLLTKRKDQNKKRKTEYLSRAQKYVEEYQKTHRELIDLKRKAKAENALYVPPEAKVVFVVRIRGINKLAPKPRKILQLLRLRQLFSGVFVKVNKATLNMLQIIQPFVTYGPPTKKIIDHLIYKRGYGKVNGQRIPLTSNKIIEHSLGRHGIICIEDLIHEITTVGPKFKQANNFLWPFKLRNPKGGFISKRHPYYAGGDWGNREERISDLVHRMI
jgi:large subunit ribosomal protein L7e